MIAYVFGRCVQLSNDHAARREIDPKLISLLEEANRLSIQRSP